MTTLEILSRYRTGTYRQTMPNGDVLEWTVKHLPVGASLEMPELMDAVANAAPLEIDVSDELAEAQRLAAAKVVEEGREALVKVKYLQQIACMAVTGVTREGHELEPVTITPDESKQGAAIGDAPMCMHVGWFGLEDLGHIAKVATTWLTEAANRTAHFSDLGGSTEAAPAPSDGPELRDATVQDAGDQP